ncbi:ATP-binding protein [Streptomyces chilikensis]|uniref:ATP-binding protein n=1 Tax=Streptomyces chilikensis TaxID=1194079 RepID=UPI000A3DA1A2|nr:ATP-binding protein [Streptomyces chilikensis]
MAESSSSQEITFRLSRSRQTTPRARAALNAVLDSWNLDPTLLQDAELVLSELVTNAVRARAPRDRQVGIRIVRMPAEGTLRLEVSDAGEGRPELRTPDDQDTGGRGLMLVDAIAERWGVKQRVGGIGKTVWADLKAENHFATKVDGGDGSWVGRSREPGGHQAAMAVSAKFS